MKKVHYVLVLILGVLAFTNFHSLYKVFMWLLAVGCGMVVGKIIIHGIILSRFLRLKMFRADQVRFKKFIIPILYIFNIIRTYFFIHGFFFLSF